MKKIAWSFNQDMPTNYEDFCKKVASYNEDIMEDRNVWNSNEIVLDNPKIDIQYEAWLESMKDLLVNEELCDDEDVFDDKENSEDGVFQVEVLAHLNADNGEYFTTGELLFKLHNQLTNKELGDHVFFEGLNQFESNNEVPSFYLYCGS